ncbi:hypothetical protein N9X87_00025 [bacterium]|nr:hypothetical protein [bacterium]
MFFTQGNLGISVNWWNLLFIASVWLMGAVVAPYLGSRAKNLATKKDIEGITSLIESVKHQFASQLENQKQTNRLSLINTERRLGAHQEIFAVYVGVLEASRQGGDLLEERCQEAKDCFKNNCLYLGNDVTKAFKDSLKAVQHTKHVFEYGDDDEIKANSEQITLVGKLILAAVEQLGFSDVESQQRERSNQEE